MMNKPQKTILFIIWLVLMVWGLIGVFQRMTTGELSLNYGSYIPWGLWVAGKVYFVGLAVGASLLTWVIYAFNIRPLKPLARISLLVSIATMIAGLIVILFDLGHMWRLYEVYTRPNFSSLLAIASWLSLIYLIYLVIVLGIDLKSGRQPGNVPRVWGWIGIFIAVTFSGANGAEFATMVSSPYWHSAIGPILSIGGAMLSGIALVLAVSALSTTDGDIDEQIIKILSRIVIGLILFVLVLEWSEYSVAMWYGRGGDYTSISSILFGHYWYVFWIVHLAIGSILPLFLLLWQPAQRLVAGFSGALVAITYMAVRLNHVIPGQITPALKGLQEAYTDKWLTFQYFPSPTEWAVFAFSVAVCIALFWLGSRILPVGSLKSVDEGGQ
ncbi:MAG: NrfD/PsrC family molybdoenzyme membrane anchor subunit [Desulfobacterales bacterium]